ncbi:MAG: 3-phosphoshikimate 1-carboxyvinyltransferase [Vulcanimicrobiaceae bacterium]
MIVRISRASRFGGEIRVPGDKSIAHRALIIGALARGWTRIIGLPNGEDVRTTARVLGDCGVAIQRNGGAAIVQGTGAPLDARGVTLDCANSGTTMRLLTGALASFPTRATLAGDASLMRRPMGRVASPLRAMGAHIELRGDTAPITVIGGGLEGVEYLLETPSAQVKSAMMLAALNASGTTRIRGAIGSRDHTERMLRDFGAPIRVTGDEIALEGGSRLHGRFVRIPGDPSSAAYWAAAASIVENSAIELRDVLLNPTRTGFFDVLARMGAQIETKLDREEPEPSGSIRVRHSRLRGVTVEACEVPRIIDELPLLAVLATFADGLTIVRGASELRVKESDRIETLAKNLRAMGAEIETFPDGFAVNGPQPLRGTQIDPHHDHRIAMACSIAALGAAGESVIHGAQCAAISYPEFYTTLREASYESTDDVAVA